METDCPGRTRSLYLDAGPACAGSRRARPFCLDERVGRLGQPLAGTVTLDTGATLLELCLYSLALAIAIIATAVALERRRAETILVVLMSAAALIAAVLIGLDLDLSRFTDLGLTPQRPQMLTVAVLGLVLSCATALHAYENYRRRRATDASMRITSTASIVAMAICLSAMVGSFGMAGTLLSFDAIEAGPINQGIVAKVLGDDEARRSVERILEQAKSDVRNLLDSHRHLVIVLRDAVPPQTEELVGDEILDVLQLAEAEFAAEAGGNPIDRPTRRSEPR